MSKNSTIKKVNVIRKGNVHVNKTRTIPEIFDVIRQAETKEEKVALLRAYDTKALRFIVNGLYNVDWSGMPVPKTTPTEHPPEVCNANISNSVTRISAAYKHRHANPKLTERNLTIVLEEVSKRERDLLIDMFKGKKVEGISKSIFKEAFPEFFRTETESSSV